MRRDPQAEQDSNDFPFLSGGKYEHSHGAQRGRGRFRPEALRPLRAAGQGAGSSAAHLRFGQAAPTLLSHEGLLYNPADGTVEFQGKTVPLSKNESRILGVLLRHKGETVSRETLMNALWETDCYVDENTLTVNVTRLRRRLESIGAPDMIQTRKGVGYLIS